MLYESMAQERRELNSKLTSLTSGTFTEATEALRNALAEVEVRSTVIEMFIGYLTLTSEGNLLHGTVLAFVPDSAAQQQPIISNLCCTVACHSSLACIVSAAFVALAHTAIIAACHSQGYMKGYQFYLQEQEGIASYTWVTNPSNANLEYNWEESVDTALDAISREVVRRGLKAPEVQNVSQVTLGGLTNQERLLGSNLMLMKNQYGHCVDWDKFEKNLWPGYVAISGELGILCSLFLWSE
jgi:hypothetical protein